MSDLVLSGLIVGLLAMVLFTPFMMAKGICSLEGEVSIGDKIVSAIPMFNLIRSEKKYKGKIGLLTISLFLLIAGVIFRVLIWYNMYNNVTMGIISMAVFWGVILLFCIANMSFVYMVIHDADAVSGLPLILLTVGFPFGQYYIGAYLANVIRHQAEQEATFRG